MRSKLRPLLIVSFAVAAGLAGIISDTASAAFDSNNIIDNSIFDNSTTMSANDIQNFLNGFPNSCLKSYIAPYPIDYTNYGENVSASTVIRRAADLWGINPQVILTTLEKEQSLVSGGVGCAGWQYNSAMGMGCPDGGSCPAPAYAGFSKQVTKGSWQLMFSRQRSEGKVSWNGDGSVPYYGNMTAGYRQRVEGGATAYYDGYMTIDGSQVYLSNGATASLYSYTPHFHGNQNFVLIFESWFGTTHGTFLLQSPASPAVYVQNGSVRYGVPSYDVLRAYGWGGVKVTPVSNQYMQSLSDGGTLGTTFKKEGEGAVYFADNGHRFGFATYNQCVDWGFPDCLNSKTLSPSLFNSIHAAGDMKSLMLHGSSVYLMEDGKKRPFLSSKAMTENGFSNASLVPVTNPINYNRQAGFSIPENNSFVSFKSSSVIYAYVDGTFYPINSYDIFTSLLPSGYKVFSDASSLYNSQLPTGQPAVPSVFKLSSTNKTYLYSGGNKYDISAVASDWPTASDFNALSGIVAAKATKGTATTNSTFQTPSGYLFKVSDRTIRPFYSLNDFFSSVYTKTPFTVSSASVSGFPTGAPLITPGAGSLYQVTTSGKQDSIYTLNADGTSCALSSMNQLGGFKFNTANVQRISDPASAGPLLRSLARDTGGAFSIISGGKRTPLPSGALTAWGIQQGLACKFMPDFLGKLTVTQTDKSMTFARLPNGTIYYAKDNQAHLIKTYATFLALGGKSSNTIDVPDDFVAYITLGTAME